MEPARVSSPRPIRVLLVAPSLDILGGQAVQASRLLACLRQLPGLQIDFQPINPNIGFIRRIKFVRTAVSFGLYVLQLLVRGWRYDLFHIFTASYSSYTLWSLPALACAKLFGKKVVFNYRDGQAEDHLRNWRSALPTLRLADAIVTPSGFLVEVFARFGITAQSIFNIIDPGDFRYRQRRQLRPIFLHNRILEPLYNIQCALRAFQRIQQRYPDASLTIAHDGPSRRELEQYAASLALRNTRFVGRVPHTEIAGLYDAADLYLTSPNFDCMPGSLLECFASGLPVIATKAGGIPFIATHEQNALLVECDDDAAMANAAFRLLEDPDLVERLTQQALLECHRYAAPAVQQQWWALYQKLLDPVRAKQTCPTP